MRRMAATRRDRSLPAARCCRSERFKDYGPNGLQVEGRAEVRRIVSGVTASLALIDAAIADGADALLVHHGLFWRGQDGRLTGWLRRARAPPDGARHQPVRLPPAAGCAPASSATTRSSASASGWRPTRASASRTWASSARPATSADADALAARAAAALRPRAAGACRATAAPLRARGLVHRRRAGLLRGRDRAPVPTPSSPARSPSRRPTWRARPAWPSWPAATMPPSATVRRRWPRMWRRASGWSTASSTSPIRPERDPPCAHAHPADDGRRRRHRPRDHRACVRSAARLDGLRRGRRRRRSCAGRAALAAPLPLAALDTPADLHSVPPGCMPVLAASGLPAGLAALPWGRVDAVPARRRRAASRHAVGAVLRGEAAAIVTAPLHKEALAAAGVPYPGPHRDAAGAGRRARRSAAAGAHDAGQRRAARRAGDDPPVAARGDRRRDLRRRARHAAHRARAPLQPGAGRGRASRWPGSIRMPARAGCSATKSSASSRRRSQAARGRRHRRAAARSRPTRSSCARARRRVRPGGGDDARPRPDPGQVPRRRARRERHARPALRAHQPGPRHRLRHRRPRHGRPVEPAGRAGDGAPAPRTSAPRRAACRRVEVPPRRAASCWRARAVARSIR